MMTVHEVSRRTGISVRALHHYDSIGLLPPAAVTEAGYRLYDGKALERLQQILLFRELEFPLKEIRRILDSPHFDRDRALEQQIRLLELRREHIDKLIALAKGVRKTGGNTMDFEAFDTQKMDEYREEARKSWGDTPAWQEYERKRQGRGSDQERQLGDGLMDVLRQFHGLLGKPADSPEAAAAVQAVQAYITQHFYTCTPAILRGLGQMYGAGGDMTASIDAACGAGTAEYAAKAIEAYTAQAEG